jgi:hypothetical protein
MYLLRAYNPYADAENDKKNMSFPPSTQEFATHIPP